MHYSRWLALWMSVGLLAGLGLQAQDQAGVPVKPVSAAEAKGHVGESIVVVGRVAEVHKTEKVAHLNFGAKFPKQTFTAVVFPAQFNTFTNLQSLEGKTVEISGKVVDYRGRPQIVLNTKGQLRVLEATATPPPSSP